LKWGKPTFFKNVPQYGPDALFELSVGKASPGDIRFDIESAVDRAAGGASYYYPGFLGD
jgi:hypothetical protein